MQRHYAEACEGVFGSYRPENCTDIGHFGRANTTASLDLTPLWTSSAAIALRAGLVAQPNLAQLLYGRIHH